MKNMQKLKYAFLVICSIILGSCVSGAATRSQKVFHESGSTIVISRTYEKKTDFQYDELADFEPISYTFEPFASNSRADASESSKYYREMNNAISHLNNERYQQAIDILKPLTEQYFDGGQALYNLAIAYINTADFDAAIKSLAYSYADGYQQAFDVIDNLNGQIGYSHLQNQEYEKAISYLKSVPATENISANILYSYMELSQRSSYPQNIINLLYAGNFIVDNGVKDSNTLNLGLQIGKQLGDNIDKRFLPNSIVILEYLVGIENNPWLNVYLGMLYSNNGQPEDAKQQFSIAAANAGDNADLLEFASKRVVELEPANFLYKNELPFTLTLKEGSISAAQFDITIALPQNKFGQSISELKVELNGEPVEYSLITDRYNSELLKLQLKGVCQKGQNNLVVSAIVSKKIKDYSAAEISNVKLSYYDTSLAEYAMYTESSEIYDLAHPLVQQAYLDLEPSIDRSNVESIVKQVYNYVINKMSYELYDNDNRPRTIILDRLAQTNYIGLCEDYAVFTASILRSFGVPSMVLAGPYLDSEIGHAWPVFYTPDFEKAIAIDTTWGDTSEMPNYYYLFNTNLTVADSVGWDSEILPQGGAFYYTYTSNIEIEMDKTLTSISK